MATSKCGTPPTLMEKPTLSLDTRCCNNGRSVLLGGMPWCRIGCDTQQKNNAAAQALYDAQMDAYNIQLNSFAAQQQAYEACIKGEVDTGIRNPDGTVKTASDNSVIYIAIGAVVLLLIVFVVIRLIAR